MPIPPADVTHYIQALERKLAQAEADKAAKDGYIDQLVEVIASQDKQIADLTSDDGVEPQDED